MLSLFPRDVLDEIWDLTESISEDFLTYFFLEYCGVGVGAQTFSWPVTEREDTPLSFLRPGPLAKK